MKLPITEIYVLSNNNKEFERISLIFMHYGYTWKSSPFFPNKYNHKLYVTLSDRNILPKQRGIGHRISLSLNNGYCIENNKVLLSYNDFIQQY